jgi:chromosome segregation ATPase
MRKAPMTILDTLRAAGLAALLAMPAAAQDTDALTTTDEVRAEIADAMDAIAEYSVQERDQALTRAREALNRLDAEIARREQALRENWADMSATARETAQTRLQDLRQARNRLGERYGALEAGARSAWGELKTGFSDAWGAFSEAWSAADEDASTN